MEMILPELAEQTVDHVTLCLLTHYREGLSQGGGSVIAACCAAVFLPEP